MATPFTWKSDCKVDNPTPNKNYVLYHSIRVFIFGVDVTPWLTSRVDIKYADRDGINVCTFSLANPNNAFVWTMDNRSGLFNLSGNIGPDQYSPASKYSETTKKTIYDKKQANNPLVFNANTWAPTSAVTAAGGTNKTQLTTQQKEAVKKSGAKLPTPNIPDWKTASGNPDKSTGYVSIFEFYVGSVIIHKQDPVRVFVKNPLTDSMDEWYCAFTGFVDTKPTSQNYINGLSTINVVCQDMRVILQNMRTQDNTFASISTGEMQIRNPTTKVTIATPTGPEVRTLAVNSLNFADLREGTRQTNHKYSGMQWFPTVVSLIHGQPIMTSTGHLVTKFGVPSKTGFQGETGFVSNKQATEGVGLFASTVPYLYNPETHSSDPTKTGLFLEDWNNLVLFGHNKKFLTQSEMYILGTATVPDGKFGDPACRFIRYLIPGKLGGKNSTTFGEVSNLIEYDADASYIGRIDWVTRYDTLMTQCKVIDYQMYVNGMGDLIFEFPMYDFKGSDFGGYRDLYKFYGHLVSDSVNDEGGPMVTAIKVQSRGAINKVNVTPSQDPSALDHYSADQLNRTVYSKVMQARIGGTEETMYVPGIINEGRLEQIALIELQKRTAQYDSFDFDCTMRPFLGVNRPIMNEVRQRFGISRSVDYTWNIRQDAHVHIDLNYVRKLDHNGGYATISGSTSTPISYSKIYTGAYNGLTGDHGTTAKSTTNAPTPASNTPLGKAQTGADTSNNQN